MIQPTNAQQLYPQPSGANAVAINIYNPQAYGSAPQQAAQQPYTYQNSLYQMPQTSLYQPVAQQNVYPAYTPAQNPICTQAQNSMMPAFQPTMSMPVYQQPMSMEQNTVAPAPQIQTDIQPSTTAEVAPVEITNKTEENIEKIDTDALINDMKNSDVDTKAEAINKIAAYVNEKPEIAMQMVTEPIINSLVDVIKEDTSALEGPTDKQIAVAEKISKGEELTPEENVIAEELSPRDKANKNRIFALFTLAMIQKLQRDELDDYIKAQKDNGEEPIAPIGIQELAGYDDIVNVINNDKRPEVQTAAIQALGYIAKPEDKQIVANILENSLKSGNEGVKAAAEEAMTKFAA